MIKDVILNLAHDKSRDGVRDYAHLSGEAATKEYRQQIKDSPPHDASATVDRACEKMFRSCHDRLRSGYEKLCRQETT